jgi:integrase
LTDRPALTWASTTSRYCDEYVWREAVAEADVPPIRLHDARHTAATIMLRSMVPVKVVTQRLGHADVAVTIRVYQHVTAQDDADAADALGRALGGS